MLDGVAERQVLGERGRGGMNLSQQVGGRSGGGHRLLAQIGSAVCSESVRSPPATVRTSAPGAAAARRPRAMASSARRAASVGRPASMTRRTSSCWTV